MATKIEFAPNEQIIANIPLTVHELIESTLSDDEICIPVQLSEVESDICHIIIGPDLYDNPEDPMEAYSKEKTDFLLQLRIKDIGGYYAHVIGGSIVSEICEQLINKIKPLVSKPDEPHHITFVISTDSYNFCVFGAQGLDCSDYERIFSPDHVSLKSAVLHSFPKHSKGFEIYNPAELYLDYERENDGIYAVVADFYCDTSSSSPVVQNVIVVKLKQ